VLSLVNKADIRKSLMQALSDIALASLFATRPLHDILDIAHPLFHSSYARATATANGGALYLRVAVARRRARIVERL